MDKQNVPYPNNGWTLKTICKTNDTKHEKPQVYASIYKKCTKVANS